MPGDELQRNHADPVSCLGTRRIVDRAGSDGVCRRNEAITPTIPHQRNIDREQRTLKHKEQILSRNCSSRRKAHGALHARIDRIAKPQDVTQNGLGHSGYGGILEIHFIAAAAGVRLHPVAQGTG